MAPANLKITYSSDNNNTRSAALDNDILHGPRPIPVDLKSCVTIHKYQMAGCELLITQVCTAWTHQYEPCHEGAIILTQSFRQQRSNQP